MLALHDLQVSFRAAMLDGDEAPAVAAILGDGLDPSARLSIYRNHVFTSLTAVLKSIYPVVCRLVDERFFAYAAHEYIRTQPPREPCLGRYGESFPAFLRAFPPCRELAYLGDVAALEWAVTRVRTAPDISPLSSRSLAVVPAKAVGNVRFTFGGSIALMSSDWPVDRIWIANQPGAEPDVSIDLADDAVRLEVRRAGRDLMFRCLSESDYAFRAALCSGEPLETAAQSALAADPLFDLVIALRQLLSDGVISGLKFPYPT